MSTCEAGRSRGSWRRGGPPYPACSPEPNLAPRSIKLLQLQHHFLLLWRLSLRRFNEFGTLFEVCTLGIHRKLVHAILCATLLSFPRVSLLVRDVTGARAAPRADADVCEGAAAALRRPCERSRAGERGLSGSMPPLLRALPSYLVALLSASLAVPLLCSLASSFVRLRTPSLCCPCLKLFLSFVLSDLLLARQKNTQADGTSKEREDGLTARGKTGRRMDRRAAWQLGGRKGTWPGASFWPSLDAVSMHAAVFAVQPSTLRRAVTSSGAEGALHKWRRSEGLLPLRAGAAQGVFACACFSSTALSCLFPLKSSFSRSISRTQPLRPLSASTLFALPAYYPPLSHPPRLTVTPSSEELKGNSEMNLSATSCSTEPKFIRIR
eukprot:439704-Pleurochrysis_carterae.AAC.2